MVAAASIHRPDPREFALRILQHKRVQPVVPQAETALAIPDIVDWAQENFFIEETRRPIVLAPHQKEILGIFTERRADGRFVWTNLMYSTIKKSGKTTISGLYARWACETWGYGQEVYNMGNNLKQAQSRAFSKIRKSVLLQSRVSPASKILKKWNLAATRMSYVPEDSFIEALPVNAEGEAGGNPSLSVWTELWGYQHDAALRFWNEMQPVATRTLSQRFIDTYAGYTNESLLLLSYWNLALPEKGLGAARLHEYLPIYGNADAGLCAYIDTGVEARRMSWQIGEVGKQYYEQAAKTEDSLDYDRLHNNYWGDSKATFISSAIWDSLELEEPYKYPLSPPKPEVRIAIDASISGDCTAIVAGMMDGDAFMELETFIYTPEHGEKIDYYAVLVPELERMFRQYRVAIVVYDEYQMHAVMTEMGKKYCGGAFPHIDFQKFDQGTLRVKADTSLLVSLRQGRLFHTGNPKLREHIKNADAQKQGDKEAIRIVKRQDKFHIDAAVCLSMCAYSFASEIEPRGDASLNHIPANSKLGELLG